MMRFSICTVLVILLISSIVVASPNFTINFRNDQYLAEGLLQIAAVDINGDGRDEILLIGRDYLEPQATLYFLGATGKEPELLWKSPNIMENKSPVLLTSGKFVPGDQLQAAVVTNHKCLLFDWDASKGYRQIAGISHHLLPWEATAGDWNQDGIDELFVTRAEKSNAQGFVKRIEVYQVQDSGLKLLATSPDQGNIRSLTTGDLDGDGRDEVIIEVGKVNSPGSFSVMGTGEEGWKSKAGPLKLVKSAVFGMNVATWRGRTTLFTADDHGKAHLFVWNNGSMEQTDEITFSAGLAGVAAGKFWPEREGLAVLAYPQSFRLLSEGEGQ